jgi:uncharacterized radical SAM superfamily Fe-S cluster-containing enzyme
MSRNCPEHGHFLSLIEEDADWYLRRGDYDKPGTPCKTQTEVKENCPLDCGLCPEHEQHTCIGLLEITDRCDLECPVCYACAGGGSGKDLALPVIEQMMDSYQDSEYGKAEILQVSGGEPTLHPEIVPILEMVKAKKFKYVMLNTNGLRIAEDEDFVRELARLRGGFEIYLQFDGFEERACRYFRGRNLAEVKKQAIRMLAKYKIPITLVSTIEKGINEHEIGDIISFGMTTDLVRGINFQPVAYFGREVKSDGLERITLTGILKRIEAQTRGAVLQDDFIPLPCNVDKVAVTYFYRKDGGFVPVTRQARIKDYLKLVKNTFAFDATDILRQTADGLLKGNFCECLSFLKDFLPVVPPAYVLKTNEEQMRFVDDNTFRISVTSFLDGHNFELKSIKKECVHVLTPDLKKIPFSTYNLRYRKAYATQ